MLRKDPRVYFSDEGPAWRYLQGLDEETPTDSKAHGGSAPTYQMAAQRIVRPHEVFPVSANKGVRTPGWGDVAHSPMVVRTMRCLLKREKVALFEEGRLNKQYSRLQHSLPVLAAAMFLAEPSRNLRALPINLMLLDLAERGIPIDSGLNSFFTMDRILWHPDAIDLDRSQHTSTPSHSVVGPVANGRGVAQVQTRDKLHLVGGEMPASPTKGGEIGGGRAFKVENYNKDESRIPENKRDTARQSWLRGQLQNQTQGFDYIFQKEVSVLIRWLATMRPYTFAPVRDSDLTGHEVEVPNWNVLFYEKDDSETTDLRDIQVLFKMRLRTLDKL